MRPWIGLLGVATVAAVGWGEWVSWRASHRALGSGGAADGSEVVLVLGHRNPGTRANAVNRWRVRTALRSLDPNATEQRIVLCGGPVAGPRSEAELNAVHLQSLDGYHGDVVLEDQSGSTWQNLLNSAQFLECFARIKVVSDPLHAEKGRRYLHRQRPDLADRLVRSNDYRLGEWWPIKPAVAVRGLLGLRRARRDLARMK